MSNNFITHSTAFKIYRNNAQLQYFTYLKSSVVTSSTEDCPNRISLDAIRKLYMLGNSKIDITVVENIIKFAQKIWEHNNFRGIKKAMRALKYIKNDAASPKESRLAILLGASRKLGGLGVNNLILNNSIELSRQARNICGQYHISPDLSIPDKKIAIEYDSDYFHDNVNRNRRDKKRIAALQHDGWKVFSIVADQMYNINALKQLGKDILIANGQTTQIRAKNFDKNLRLLLDALS